MRRGTGKYLLKKLLERYLPAEHVHRRKSGFDIPLGLWFRGELRGFLEDALCEEAIRRVGFFDPHVVQAMVRTHMSGARNFEARLWRILVAQVWAERCLQAPTPQPDAVPAFATA
jgi:asparagine synthase (glutamine-hydrolysing)